MRLTVKQRQYSTNYYVEIDEFKSLQDVFTHFKTIYGGYRLEERFSFNSDEKYPDYRSDRWSRVDGIVRYIPPVYKMTITNENGVRYSTEYIAGMFHKFRKKQQNYFFYGYKRHHRGHYHKRPHTLQEYRMSTGVLVEEGEPKWRPSRNHHNLPNTYDDIPMLDQNDRNWKRYRKTQWK